MDRIRLKKKIVIKIKLDKLGTNLFSLQHK